MRRRLAGVALGTIVACVMLPWQACPALAREGRRVEVTTVDQDAVTDERRLRDITARCNDDGSISLEGTLTDGDDTPVAGSTWVVLTDSTGEHARQLRVTADAKGYVTVDVADAADVHAVSLPGCDEASSDEATAAVTKAREERRQAEAVREAAEEQARQQALQAEREEAARKAAEQAQAEAQKKAEAEAAKVQAETEAKATDADQPETTSVGEELAWLAVRCAGTASPDDTISEPNAYPWNKVDDSRLSNEYAVMDATVGASGGNCAYASCTQAAAGMVAAVVDPAAGTAGPTQGPPEFQAYLENRPDLYEHVDVRSVADLRPGDILSGAAPGYTGAHHTAIYVGNELARKRFPNTDGVVYQAAYSGTYARYPTISPLSQDAFDWMSYQVFRPKTKATGTTFANVSNLR